MKIIKFYLYRLQWYLAEFIDFKYPVHLDIELTSRCNLKCSFCFRNTKNKKFKDGDMDFETVHKILNQAKWMGVKSVKFNWRGESTLSKLFVEVIERANKMGFFVYCNTALSWNMPIDIIKSMAKNIRVLKVSFDSSNKKVYERIRKDAKFKMTMYNIFWLCIYRDLYKMPKLIFSRRVIDGMESDKEYKDFIKKHFGGKFDIRSAMPRNENMKHQLIRERKYCGHPSRRLTINWDGDVFVCCVAYDLPFELYLGNMKHQRLKELWNDKKRKNLIKDLKYDILNNACRNCTSSDAYK